MTSRGTPPLASCQVMLVTRAGELDTTLQSRNEWGFPPLTDADVQWSVCIQKESFPAPDFSRGLLPPRGRRWVLCALRASASCVLLKW